MADTNKSGDHGSQGPSLPPLELGDLPAPTARTGEPGSSASLGQDAGQEQHVTTGAEAGPEVDTSRAEEQEMSRQAIESRPSEADQVRPLPAPIRTDMPAMTRTNSEAIGPPTDLPTPMLQVPPSAQLGGPIIQFTLLLASTGTRHPFQLNERYLSKRNVTAKTEDGSFDPSTISVYNLKELILKDWRDDWDQKPSSPSAIRLIFFGQLLSDNVSLKECKLQTDGTPNVLHITVKPQEVMDDEEAGKGKASMSRDRDGGDRGAGCRCVIL